jgi:TRAP transporter TAXI family solute receptor
MYGLPVCVQRTFAAGLLIAALTATSVEAAGAGEKLPPRITIGASAGGSLQNALATGLAKVVSNVASTIVVVQPFAGTSAFFPLVDSGELDLGLASAVDFAMSYRGPKRLKVNGENPYPLAENLRLVMGGSPLIVGFVVRKKSDLHRVEDLKGHRVAGEFPAHLGARFYNYSALTGAQLGKNNVTIVPFSGIGDGLQALVDGRVDAAAFGVGGPQIREADANVGVRFLSSDCSPAGRERIRAAVPGHYLIDLKAGSYAGVTEDICTVAFQNYVVAGANENPAVVSAFIKGTWDNIDKLAKLHPSLRLWTREAMVPQEPTIPFHPAAIAFYKSVGAWTPALDKKQKELLALTGK